MIWAERVKTIRSIQSKNSKIFKVLNVFLGISRGTWLCSQRELTQTFELLIYAGLLLPWSRIWNQVMILFSKRKKTGKERRLTLNSACAQTIQDLLGSADFRDTEQLFKGRRGEIKTTTIIYLVKQWTSLINLKGNYGSHSLRKTWG